MRKIIPVLVLLALLSVAAFLWFKPNSLPKNQNIDKLVVLKSERKLLAFADGKLLRTYHIALGRNPVGHKEFEGDCRTPEGNYTINNKNPNSGYHINLGISYPNSQDLAKAKFLGKPAGGAIKIHGMRNGHAYLGLFHTFSDWTYGCIAVTNAAMDELYAQTPIGTPIEIRP